MKHTLIGEVIHFFFALVTYRFLTALLVLAKFRRAMRVSGCTDPNTRLAVLTTRSSIVMEPTGSICFGARSVRGRRRVPNPPTRTIAFMGSAVAGRGAGAADGV